MHKQEVQPQQLTLPETIKFNFEFTEDELQTLAWVWFAFLRGVETCQMLHPLFEKLGSKYSAQIYGQAYDYRHLVKIGHQIIARLTAQFEEDPLSNWRVLKWVNNYSPKIKTPLLSNFSQNHRSFDLPQKVGLLNQGLNPILYRAQSF